MLADPAVVAALRAGTVPVRLLLGHRIDPQHVTYFPEALKIADRFGVRGDPAFLLISPGGQLRWKHVGMISKDDLLAALCPSAGRPRDPRAGPSQPPCALLAPREDRPR